MFEHMTKEHKYMLWAGVGVVAYFIYQKSVAANVAATTTAAQTALAMQAYQNANPTIALDPNWQNAVAPIPTDAGNTLPAQQCNAQGGSWFSHTCVLPPVAPATLQGLASVVVRRKGWGA